MNETRRWRESPDSAPGVNNADIRWRTSSYSGSQGNCVEVGHAQDTIGVRDTKNRPDATLVFDVQTWSGFLTALKTGRYT